MRKKGVEKAEIKKRSRKGIYNSRRKSFGHHDAQRRLRVQSLRCASDIDRIDIREEAQTPAAGLIE
jgi:hypothetical protein